MISLVISIWQLVARYPALTAGIFNVVIIAGAAIGLHLTNSELAGTAGFVAALTALIIHSGVIPTAKVTNVKAGLKPTVPNTVNVAVPRTVSDVPVRVVPRTYPPVTQPIPVVKPAVSAGAATTILSAGNRFRVI